MSGMCQPRNEEMACRCLSESAECEHGKTDTNIVKESHTIQRRGDTTRTQVQSFMHSATLLTIKEVLSLE